MRLLHLSNDSVSFEATFIDLLWPLGKGITSS